MFKNIIAVFNNFFSTGHERTLLAKKNIFYSLILKGGGIIIGLMLVPLTISYINPSRYGIWLTLSSIISWFNFFDIGLGNGLKNRIAESNAKDRYNESKIFVSTTYGILSIISLVIFVIFWIANRFINWNSALNAGVIPIDELKQIALLLFGAFCLQFVVQTINSVLNACHAQSKVSLIIFLSQFFTLIVIFILTRTTKASFLYLTLTLGGMPVLVQFIASLWYYNRGYKFLAPNIKLTEFRYAKSLLSIGGAFFIIQLGGLILYQTDNILVSQIFGPQYVTVFNIAYKIFSVVIMILTIIVTPLWSAFTDAYAKEDMDWIKKMMSKMYKYFASIIVVCILLLFTSPYIYKLWIGNLVKVPFTLSIAMAFYTIGFCWVTIHCIFLNGIGKIKVQLYLYLICIFINVPMGIIGAKLFGITGVTYSNVFIFIMMGVILYIQIDKIINKKAVGIWNK